MEVNYLYRFDEGDIPYNKSAGQCLDEFDNYNVKQQHFNTYVSNQLKRNAIMINHFSDLMFRIANDVKGLGTHASMGHSRLEQVAKSQNDLLNEMNNNMNDHVVRVMTRGGRMIQEPLYPEGHPKRVEQDSQELMLMHLLHKIRKRKKTIGLCIRLVNPRWKNLMRIVMMFLFLMLRHSLVMNIFLVVMIMLMMIMLMVNQKIIKNVIMM